MKVSTLLKAGSLAFEIFNHQSTQSLSSLIQNGVKRRVAMRADSPRQPARPIQSQTRQDSRHPAYRRAPQYPSVMATPFPKEPVKKALKYVTPENIQKAIQWQEIVKSFISKN